MSSIALAFVLCAGVGVGVLASNPRRPLNRAFAAFSLLTGAWLAALARLGVSNPSLPWLRAAAAAGAAFPAVLWWIKTCAETGGWPAAGALRRGWPWFTATAVLAALALLPGYTGGTGRAAGPLQPVYAAGLAALYVTLFATAWAQGRRLEGIARVELQTFLLGGIGATFAAVVLTVAGPVLHRPGLLRTAPLVVIAFYGGTAYAISTRRIFEARQVFLTGLRWLAVSLVLSAWILGWEQPLGPLFGRTLGAVVAVGSGVALFVLLEEPLRRLFSFGLQSRLQLNANTRRNLLVATREIAELRPLRDRLEAILLDWSGASSAEVLTPDPVEGGLTGRAIHLGEPGLLRALGEEKWVTPESLRRRRLTPAQERVLRFLEEQGIAALAVRCAWSTDEVVLAVALGPKVRHAPYTFPECQELLEWTDLIENAIARSILTVQAREAEHIATVGMMGASIAHEIRNPLVALSATAELLEEKHHDPEFRRTFSALIDREVNRIKAISEQLRGLSPAPEPQLVRVRLGGLIQECIQLVQARAAKAGAEIIFPSGSAEIDAFGDAGALRQVLLNLLGNALDAVEPNGPNGRIHVVASRISASQILIDISDNGKGVAPQQRKRLFMPFSSDKTHGFGLGLATSAKLMRSQQGSIALVDRPGPGATFRLTLSCPSPAAPNPPTS